jgi:hypothetical protein
VAQITFNDRMGEDTNFRVISAAHFEAMSEVRAF